MAASRLLPLLGFGHSLILCVRPAEVRDRVTSTGETDVARVGDFGGWPRFYD